jgi:hypothetical protein
MNALRRLFRRITRRRALRVAGDLEVLLQILNEHKQARKAFREVLRVRGYEQ